jgi:CheY-like chemotaxis protein
MTTALHAATPSRPADGLGAAQAVLVVDGPELTRRMLSSRLARHGFKAVEVPDGTAAARALSAGHGFGAVVLSTPLPDTGAAAFAAWLRSRPETWGVQLVVLAAEEDAGLAAEAYRHGAALVLSKPVDLDLVAHKLASLSRLAAVAVG